MTAVGSEVRAYHALAYECTEVAARVWREVDAAKIDKVYNHRAFEPVLVPLIAGSYGTYTVRLQR